MLIRDFVNKAIEQDRRNTFEATKLNFVLPDELNEFYENANPIDVEISMEGNAVKFVPAAQLKDIQRQYFLGEERFIFASCNGDPIYIYNNKIYTCYHGANKVEDELLAKSFSHFLTLID